MEKIDNKIDNLTINNLELGIIGLEPFLNKQFFDIFFYNIPGSIRVKNYVLVSKDNLPHMVIVTFNNDKSKAAFIEKYANKNYPDINIPIQIKDDITDLDKKDISLDHKKNIITFKNDYSILSSLKYERTMKESGLVFKDKQMMEAQDKVISFLAKQFTKSLFNGESIMNISLPVTIFDERTLLQV